MNKENALQIVKLSSKLVTWSNTLRNRIPDLLYEDICEVIKMLDGIVFEEEMNNEKFLDHIALTTLVESLRKTTHPMSNNDPHRLTYLAYETAACMYVKREETFTELANKHLKESDLNHLNLTESTLQVLMTYGICTVQQLTECTENQVLRIPSLGRKMLNEIKAGLLANGLKLKD